MNLRSVKTNKCPIKIRPKEKKAMKNSSFPAELSQLARDIDAFAFDYDSHEYKDQIEDREENVQGVYSLLNRGKAEPLCTWLSDLIAEEEDAEIVIRANMLLERVKQTL